MATEPRHETHAGGACICPKCEARVPHRRGVPCRDERCPACGVKLLREGSYHHRLWLAKHKGEAE